MNTNQSTVREALRRLVVAVQRSSDYSIMLLADAYALAAHIEACHETSGDGYHGPWSYCGDNFQVRRYAPIRTALSDIWYCSVAQRYLPQK